jgi:hypothetical protein
VLFAIATVVVLAAVAAMIGAALLIRQGVLPMPNLPFSLPSLGLVWLPTATWGTNRITRPSEP